MAGLVLAEFNDMPFILTHKLIWSPDKPLLPKLYEPETLQPKLM